MDGKTKVPLEPKGMAIGGAGRHPTHSCRGFDFRGE